MQNYVPLRTFERGLPYFHNFQPDQLESENICKHRATSGFEIILNADVEPNPDPDPIISSDPDTARLEIIIWDLNPDPAESCGSVRKSNLEGQQLHIHNFFKSAFPQSIRISAILRKCGLKLHMLTSGTYVL